jgi:hypothetical protein
MEAVSFGNVQFLIRECPRNFFPSEARKEEARFTPVI